MAAQQDVMIMPGSEAPPDALAQAPNGRPEITDDAHHGEPWPRHDAGLMEQLLYSFRTAFAVPHT